MIPSDKIIVALDTTDEKKISSLFKILEDKGIWVKIGLELFYAHGPRFVMEAKERNLKVFLDLKLHDIPNTVAHGMKSLCQLPIDMVNLHAGGGSEMMKRASDVVKSSSHSPLLIAVTQLTSTSEAQMNQELKIPGAINDHVAHLAKLAHSSGCDGVVSSPKEVPLIKQVCGAEFLTVTPGIRPGNVAGDDQKRTTTPMEAIHSGSDFLVIGRPITEAPDPARALEDILKG